MAFFKRMASRSKIRQLFEKNRHSLAAGFELGIA